MGEREDWDGPWAVKDAVHAAADESWRSVVDGRSSSAAPKRRWVEIAVRSLGGLLALGAGAIELLLLLAVLSSRFGGPSGDPHGYAMVFGVVFSVPVSAVLALGVTMLVPSRLRPRTALIAVLGAVAFVVLLIVLAATTPSWVPPPPATGSSTS